VPLSKGDPKQPQRFIFEQADSKFWTPQSFDALPVALNCATNTITSNRNGELIDAVDLLAVERGQEHHKPRPQLAPLTLTSQSALSVVVRVAALGVHHGSLGSC
jgi:hypothetical protein